MTATFTSVATLVGKTHSTARAGDVVRIERRFGRKRLARPSASEQVVKADRSSRSAPGNLPGAVEGAGGCARSASIVGVKYVSLARASSCALAVTLSSCYWLAQYQDLSSAFGDAGSVVDAGSVADGGPVAEPFCPPDAGALAYCMAFDGVDASVLALEVYEADAAIVNGTYLSPPSSLFVGLQDAASFGRYAVSFPFQPTTTRLEFQIRTVGLNEGVTTLAITLLQASTETARTMNVVVSPYGGFQLQEYFALADGGIEMSAHPTYQVDGGGAPPGWHYVVLTLTVDDAKEQYFSGLTVDNQVLEDGGQPLALPWAEGTASLHIGVTYAAAGAPQSFFFDNVRAEFGL